MLTTKNSTHPLIPSQEGKITLIFSGERCHVRKCYTEQVEVAEGVKSAFKSVTPLRLSGLRRGKGLPIPRQH